MEASPKADLSPRTSEALAQHTHAAEEARKWIVAASVILCTILEVLDSSIVNVALPHMQGSFSATVDEVTWVVTTYLVAAGIMIPTTGWIAGRFGRKRYSAVQSQATMIALNNIYRMLTGVMILAVSLTVLLPRPAGKAPAGAH